MAVIVAVAALDTVTVEIANVAEDAPAGMVTEAGTLAFELLEVNFTVNPFDGAGPFRLIVPELEAPPITELGDRVRPESPTGFNVSWVVNEVLPCDAVSVTVVEVSTADVDAVTEADEAPPGTATVVGSDTMELLDDRFTVIPPAGAFPLSVTVAVAETPPRTELGDTANPEKDVGPIDRVPDAVLMPSEAVIVAVLVEFTARVEIANVSDIAPAATSTC